MANLKNFYLPYPIQAVLKRNKIWIQEVVAGRKDIQDTHKTSIKTMLTVQP